MKLKDYIIGIAIIILTVSVVVYGTNTFYKSPNYSDFCDEFRGPKLIDNQTECLAVGGEWNGGYCDTDFECRKDYDSAREVYSRNVFIVALPVGIAIIVAGALIFGVEAIGAGLMGGGIGVILWGVGNYWPYSGDALRFALSLLGLAAVIWLAYWMNKRKQDG